MSAIFIIIVSIHAPYAGSDTTPRVLCGIPSVSIHAPYAGSDFKVHERAQEIYEFQSTPPMQGATESARRFGALMGFQSTPPMQGATVGSADLKTALLFQSTPPMQGATS